MFHIGIYDVRKEFYVSLDYFMYRGYLSGHFHAGQLKMSRRPGTRTGEGGTFRCMNERRSHILSGLWTVPRMHAAGQDILLGGWQGLGIIRGQLALY